jgi:adenylate cyclase
MKEIERKFLVVGDFKQYVTKSYPIAQGYLSTDPERTVRVRLKGDKGYITIKGVTDESGLSRFEWEKEIPAGDVKELLTLCKPGTIIQKIRNELIFNKKCFEIDVFADENEGLILAEVELRSENEEIELPAWIGKEVTGDRRYYNSYISEHPFTKWES